MIGCFSGFHVDMLRFPLAVASIVIALVLLFILKRFDLSTKYRVSLIFGHLTALFFPVALYSVNFACSAMCLSCGNSMLQLLLISLPTTLTMSSLTGFVVIPLLYIRTNRGREISDGWIESLASKHSEKLNLRAPRIYAVNKSRPLAFSLSGFKSAIFLSVGLLDVFSKKEVESVLLHELAHIKLKSSVTKFSESVLRLFSPIALFAGFNTPSSEEEKADRHVILEQGTWRHLNSAKRKMKEFT